jgi:hypothetical protein
MSSSVDNLMKIGPLKNRVGHGWITLILDHKDVVNAVGFWIPYVQDRVY